MEDSEDFLRWSKAYSGEDLLVFFVEFRKRAINLMGHLWPPLGPEEWIVQQIEERLSKYINPKEEFSRFKEILSILLKPKEKSKVQLMKEELAAGKVDEAYQKYAWLFNHGLNFKLPSKKEFIEQTSVSLVENDNLKENKLISQYNFDEELLHLCETAKKFPIVRFMRLEAIVEGAYCQKDLFMKMGEKFGFKICLAYFWEIEELLKGNEIDIEKIKKRENLFGFIYLNDEFFDLNPQQIDELKKKVEIVSEANEVKGQTACLGKVIGKTKVLLSAKENHKVEEGDILVTSMTTPDYVPAMEKAAAIVTDEGGITCHAAIVSREMNKPCVIGTKVATQVFKDGDLIEVDAVKGIVRKL